MIKLFVSSQSFGQPMIAYKVVDKSNANTVVDEGKCEGYEYILDVYYDLLKEHGEDNVRILMR